MSEAQWDVQLIGHNDATTNERRTAALRSFVRLLALVRSIRSFVRSIDSFAFGDSVVLLSFGLMTQ